MRNCREIIKYGIYVTNICEQHLDESVHGAFSGYIFQREAKNLTDEENTYIRERIAKFMSEMYQRIENLLDFVYEEKEIREDIQKFANYNFNRTLKNLGYREVFEGKDIDFHSKIKEEVEDDAGVTMIHDIFSMTGKVYFMMQHDTYSEKNQKHIEEKIKVRHNLTPKLRVPKKPVLPTK